MTDFQERLILLVAFLHFFRQQYLDCNVVKNVFKNMKRFFDATTTTTLLGRLCLLFVILFGLLFGCAFLTTTQSLASS